DHQEVPRLDDGRAERAAAAVEDRELAEEVPLAELGDGLEPLAALSVDAHAAALDHVHRSGLVADVEDQRVRRIGLHDALLAGVRALSISGRARHPRYANAVTPPASKSRRLRRRSF